MLRSRKSRILEKTGWIEERSARGANAKVRGSCRLPASKVEARVSPRGLGDSNRKEKVALRSATAPIRDAEVREEICAMLGMSSWDEGVDRIFWDRPPFDALFPCGARAC
jgi:hypothetical protein